VPGIGISCDGRESITTFRDKIAAGETGGASSVWLASHLFQRDPITQAAMALASTSRMRAVLMAISPYLIHPVHAAMTAASLDEFFPGRVALCYAVGAPADLAAIGVEAAKPIRVLREAIELTRALLQGETVRFAGESFKTHNRRLTAGQRPVPILLAASGPQMLELAGSIADGVLISAGASIEFVKWSLQHVHRGARGRSVQTYGLVYASVDADAATAHARLQRTLAIVLRGGHHSRNLQLAGNRLDQDTLNRAVLAEDWTAAQGMITDDILSRHAASGRPEEVHARLAAYHDAGLDEVVIAGAGSGAQVTETIRAALQAPR
jgi:5,10-methylenetetrahydromethanopterin reductase